MNLFKVKISAMEYGKVVKFNHTFETPDFEPKQYSFLDRPYSVLEQQDDWLDANYHLVVELCEARYLHPIIGYEVINPKLKFSKKQRVMALLATVSSEMGEEQMALVLGTLNDLWPNVKTLTPERILTIVFESVNTTTKVSTAILKDLNEKIGEINKLKIS